jgi:hypothetical protein
MINFVTRHGFHHIVHGARYFDGAGVGGHSYPKVQHCQNENLGH